MSNIIPIGLPKRPNMVQRQSAFVTCFAAHRRRVDDVYWLKENAELLNILASSGAKLRPEALAIHRGFYEKLEERFRFFPQYYRFLLSICLDLEALGMKGDVGQRLCARVAESDLVASELSDLQRAEAHQLLARREQGSAPADLKERLLAFMSRADTFSLPNKKVAYELTHIVFYLSNYGASPFTLPDAALTSLEYAGLLAYLDQDVDLLSEVCVALRFAGKTPSDIWEDWLATELQAFTLVQAQDGAVQDAYHEYLVTSWWAIVSGMSGFPGTPVQGGMHIRRARAAPGPLRAISELMYHLGPARSGDWGRMRPLLHRSLAQEHHHILEGAAQSSTRFDAFFEGFARAK